MKDITPGELRKVAAERIHDISVGDLSAQLAIKNAEIGIGKMIFALQSFGYDHSKLKCVFSPDGGITRNKDRWAAGFGYGCALVFPFINEKVPIFFPEIRPNACGVIMAKIEEFPEPASVVEKMRFLEKSMRIKGKKIKLNLGTSNHFIETYVVDKADAEGVKKNDKLALLHASPAEFKKELVDLDHWTGEGGEYLDTPLGKIFYVMGSAAIKYLKRYYKIDQFSSIRREAILRELFSVTDILINANHQGIFADGIIRLGLYDTAQGNGQALYPITLSWDKKVYLVSKAGKADRSSNDKKLRSQNDLVYKDMNILPHGGGYKLPNMKLREDLSSNGVLCLEDKDTRLYIKHPGDLPFGYRTTGILQRIEQYGLGKVVGEMSQVYTLKY